MILPDFRDDGWLPDGHHKTDWEELERRFAGEQGSKRAAVWANLILWRDRMRQHKITGELLIDGSFISTKKEPGDFDAIFIGDEGIEPILLEDVEARLLLNYQIVKEYYGGDLLFFSKSAILKFPNLCRIDGFDYSKEKILKGVVVLPI
jgi:hypothetical protein